VQFINKNTNFYNFVSETLSNKDKSPFLYVGAGISVASQLPSWNAFIGNCVKEAFKENLSVSQLANIHQVENGSVWLIDAAREEAKKNKISEYEMLHRSLWGKNPDTIKPSSIHYLIVLYAKKFKVPIFTTNYDDLLEQAALTLNINMPTFEKINKDTKVDRFCLIYLHGKLPQKVKQSKRKSVASKISYYQEYNNLSGPLGKFRSYLSKNSCLFIGTSLTDDNINRCLLYSVQKNGPEHFWFTRMNATSSFEKEVHRGIWKYLRVNPVYCSTKDYTEVTTAFRRALTSVDFKESGMSNFKLSAKAYNFISKKFNPLMKTVIFKRCIGPFDEYELDLYFDLSIKKDQDLTLKRVWSSGINFTDFSKKTERNFNLSKSVQSDTFKEDSKSIPSLVKETMDTLSIHSFVREPDFTASNSDNNDTGISNPRSWGFISFPVFIPQLGRCGAVFVLKYTNKNNLLQSLSGQDKTFEENIKRDIIKLGILLTDEFLEQ
jgi:NAD-dependent SIR2 family protein deacetylase